MKKQYIKKIISKLPDAPGVYFFVRKNKILYIGKATSLRDRVKSYFGGNIEEARGPLISKMLSEFGHIKFQKTDSVLEALILEANLIKKHQPPANIKEKDNRSFNYVVITKENFPRVLVMEVSSKRQ
jgi:excinuclease ABC subunit C